MTPDQEMLTELGLSLRDFDKEVLQDLDNIQLRTLMATTAGEMLRRDPGGAVESLRSLADLFEARITRAVKRGAN